MLYTVLAHRGFFPVEELSTFRKIDSRLQGHPDRVKLPGVEISTGPDVAIGVDSTLALRMWPKVSPPPLALLWQGLLPSPFMSFGEMVRSTKG